jgi:hypothetical protein
MTTNTKLQNTDGNKEELIQKHKEQIKQLNDFDQSVLNNKLDFTARDSIETHLKGLLDKKL